ncbi:hypothetical protein NSR39_002720 [Salmonella enterica]|nr:hypothetical protein [Salmonella enterica]EJF6000982.1 hypothetical protein [Salmonella enterica]EJF6028670.1 hypothetical protein [Salmonella enterica]EJF6190029.1 hypothetical protein [Salmonella enterica]EJW2074249.1 hypothetical protein [Salmonella enterica]
MIGNGKLRKTFSFLLILVLTGTLSVHAALKGGSWQEVATATGAINGTPPRADGAAVPVYQGSVQLIPDELNVVNFTAMPRDFSVDDSAEVMLPVNPADTEGDLLAAPSFQWENNQPPSMMLVWADAATPDEPLNPQPVPNKTFCQQNMAGRQLVVWSQIDTRDPATIPALYLLTRTGVPNKAVTPLLEEKYPIKINPAVGDPVAITADHFDETLTAAKVKVGESITLTITTRNCSGEPVGNTAFIITREDAKNRQGAINNTNPVHVGDTELTTTATEYHGVTNSDGLATVTVRQDDGLGVRTTLKVSPVGNTTLSDTIDVIFTTLTSPDSDKANMWGHMEETSTADVDGESYTFTRPALKAEAGDSEGSINASNETWARFAWHGADSHCEILPNARQLMGLKAARGDLATTLGWPVAGTGEYWSSSESAIPLDHLAVNMRSANVMESDDKETLLVSCVDKAAPEVTPNITLHLDNMSDEYNAAMTEVGNSINMVVRISDRATGEALPYHYFEIWLGEEKNRKGQTNAEARAENSAFGWADQQVAISMPGAGVPGRYRGVTDENGTASLVLTQDDGAGVLTPLRVVLADGTEVTTNVIFTVVTSPPPETNGVRMWGHMRGVVDAGQIYKRPLLEAETSKDTGSQIENRETWATFNSVAAATNQCGTGQVPGQSSLDSLYNSHSSNTMETEHGWPTGEHSYITADFDGTQTTHVNLGTGVDSQFSGTAPNYLTCSGNEMIAQLDVYFSDNPEQLQSVAKVGERIKMNVHSTSMLGGQMPNVRFTVTMQLGKRRDGATTGFTDPSYGELVMNGTTFGPTHSSMTYEGITDAQGNAEVIIEQPQGVGLKTMLSVEPRDSLVSTPAVRSVTFTVPTSPDTADANMWGHMPETLTVNDMTFIRPRLATEVSSDGRTQTEANETWARVTHTDAAGNTSAGGCDADKLPRMDQLQALYAANSGGAIHSVHGWPVAQSYWSSSFATATSWKHIALSDGTESTGNAGTDIYVSCLAAANPQAASIEIEPVDASLWYDANGEHAVKVKKGDTLALKVTVKDASGAPLPQAPFVLTRGDGYTRKGEKHVAGSGDGIVSPVVIDGESLNDTTAKIGGITGVDGSKIINVTRPDTHGTKAAITAALFENQTVTASIDTIFTVVTSPDVPEAKMWGHMAETLTANDGSVFQRPLLYDEVRDTTSLASTTENNETWARLPFNTYKTNSYQCPPRGSYYPTDAQLEALYNTWPSGSMMSVQGWPESYSYWSSSLGTTNPIVIGRTGISKNRYSVALSDGGNKVDNVASGVANYQTCTTTKREMVPAHITLTSTLPSENGMIKVKAGEVIPLQVRVTDAQGQPVEGVAVALTVTAPVARNSSYSYPYSIYLNPWLSAQGDSTQGTAWNETENQTPYVITGIDGTFEMEMHEDGSLGVQRTLVAKVYEHEEIVSESLIPIFTVPTSPDSDKANMWGHMPETFTASNGAKFNRPLLYSELPSGNLVDTTKYSERFVDNETWYTIKNFDKPNHGACSIEQMPAIADYTSLYNDHPSGAIRTDLGLPDGTDWWAGDKTLQNQSSSWQSISLKTGKVAIRSSNSSSYLQLCLTAPRQAASITLTSSAWNADKSAAVVKKGEALPMTLTVTRGGQPQAGAIVKISRGDAYTRGSRKPNTEYTGPREILPPTKMLSSGSDKTASTMTLTSVSPAGGSAILDSSSQYWYGLTGDDGTLQFTLNQDNTIGLKTAVTASLDSEPSTTANLDTIFTVPTSPDSPYASYWGHLPETVQVNGNTLHRPPLYLELPDKPAGQLALPDTSTGELWGTGQVHDIAAHADIALSTLCGSMENAATMDDLKALQSHMSALSWPTSSSYDYLSQDMEDGRYCTFNETTGQSDCTRNGAYGYGFAVCRVQ